jgi:hypothetical protein
MSNQQHGKLVLQEVPAGEVEKKVFMLLSKFAKSASAETLSARIRNTPFVLSHDIAIEKAQIILEALQKLGAEAVFVPHVSKKPDIEQITRVEPEPQFTLGPPQIPKEKPLSQKPAPKKNGARRLTLILVTLLLFLSLGFLTWQLWPILEDIIRWLGLYLAQLF